MTYPPSDHVEVFYDESERLVRFLVTTDKRSFLALLDALGRHQPFESVLPVVYAGTFANPSGARRKIPRICIEGLRLHFAAE